jgi:hypothetical protein
MLQFKVVIVILQFKVVESGSFVSWHFQCSLYGDVSFHYIVNNAHAIAVAM